MATWLCGNVAAWPWGYVAESHLYQSATWLVKLSLSVRMEIDMGQCLQKLLRSPRANIKEIRPRPGPAEIAPDIAQNTENEWEVAIKGKDMAEVILFLKFARQY